MEPIILGSREFVDANIAALEHAKLEAEVFYLFICRELKIICPTRKPHLAMVKPLRVALINRHSMQCLNTHIAALVHAAAHIGFARWSANSLIEEKWAHTCEANCYLQLKDMTAAIEVARTTDEEILAVL